MNPSPTGHYTGTHNRTSPQQVMRYLNRLCQGHFDRFDLSIEVPLLPLGGLQNTGIEARQASKYEKKC